MELKEIISSGLIELHALGMASPEESKQVEAWIDMYPEVATELDEIQAGMEHFALLHAVQPSPVIKQKILEEISSENKFPYIPLTQQTINTSLPLNGKEKAVVYTINSFFKWAAAACFILLIGSLALTYIYYDKYNKANTELAFARDEMNQQKLMATNMDTMLSKMTDKNAMPIALNGTPAAPGASAKIFWMKDGGGEVYVTTGALPKAPVGMQYQLWAIIDGKPVDGGMISNQDSSRYHLQKMNSFGNVKVEAFAITLEKQGGNPTPKGEMFVIAKI